MCKVLHANSEGRTVLTLPDQVAVPACRTFWWWSLPAFRCAEVPKAFGDVMVLASSRSFLWCLQVVVLQPTQRPPVPQTAEASVQTALDELARPGDVVHVVTCSVGHNQNRRKSAAVWLPHAVSD